jgi:hypothetical protein
MGETFWVSLINLIAVIIGFLWQAYREARNRRWANEDRVRLSKENLQAIKENTNITKENMKHSTEILEEIRKYIYSCFSVKFLIRRFENG